MDVCRVSQPVHSGVDFGTETACASTYGLVVGDVCPRTMLMRTDDSGVDHGVFVVAVLGQDLKYFLPYAAFTPPRMVGLDLNRSLA